MDHIFNLMKPVTHWHIVQALFHNGSVWVCEDHDHNGYLQHISREDGSGKCFNITYRTQLKSELRTVFVRTTD